MVRVNVVWKASPGEDGGPRYETFEVEAAYARDGMLVMVTATSEHRYERHIPADRFHEFTVVKPPDRPLSKGAIDALSGGSLTTAGRIPDRGRRDLFKTAQGRTNAPAAPTEEPAVCPTCGSADRGKREMTGCGFVCDDPYRWHANRAGLSTP